MGDETLVGFQSNLGRLFRGARKTAGLTQAELAEQAHIGISAVQAVEQGRGRVSSLNAILKTLGLETRGRQLSAGPIGPALVLARKRRKMSRRRLAKALGVSRNTLVAVEQGGGLTSTLEFMRVRWLLGSIWGGHPMPEPFRSMRVTQPAITNGEARMAGSGTLRCRRRVRS